jgi:hypothetical protein
MSSLHTRRLTAKAKATTTAIRVMIAKPPTSPELRAAEFSRELTEQTLAAARAEAAGLENQIRLVLLGVRRGNLTELRAALQHAEHVVGTMSTELGAKKMATNRAAQAAAPALQPLITDAARQFLELLTAAEEMLDPVIEAALYEKQNGLTSSRAIRTMLQLQTTIRMMRKQIGEVLR